MNFHSPFLASALAFAALNGLTVSASMIGEHTRAHRGDKRGGSVKAHARKAAKRKAFRRAKRLGHA